MAVRAGSELFPGIDRVAAYRRNDYFNFWLPRSKRPDDNYTEGLAAEVWFSSQPRFARRLFGNLPTCQVEPLSASRCAVTSVGLTQEIYTPEIDARELIPGQRPYLGWLAVGYSLAGVGVRRLDRFSLQIGATGSPSLAEPAQRFVHRVLGFREPLGWDGQLPFEVGIVVGYEGSRVLTELTTGGGRIAGATAHTRIRLGNISTDVEAGICAQVGWRVDSCLGAAPPRRRRFSIGVRIAAFADLVMRDISLDGPTFTRGPSVVKKAGALRRELGLIVGYGKFTIDWTAIRTSREYRTQAGPHEYSRIRISIHK